MFFLVIGFRFDGFRWFSLLADLEGSKTSNNEPSLEPLEGGDGGFTSQEALVTFWVFRMLVFLLFIFIIYLLFDS